MTCKLLLLLLGTKILKMDDTQLRREINFYTQLMPPGTVMTIKVPNAVLDWLEILNDNPSLLASQDENGMVTIKRIE